MTSSRGEFDKEILKNTLAKYISLRETLDFFVSQFTDNPKQILTLITALEANELADQANVIGILSQDKVAGVLRLAELERLDDGNLTTMMLTLFRPELGKEAADILVWLKDASLADYFQNVMEVYSDGLFRGLNYLNNAGILNEVNIEPLLSVGKVPSFDESQYLSLATSFNILTKEINDDDEDARNFLAVKKADGTIDVTENLTLLRSLIKAGIWETYSAKIVNDSQPWVLAEKLLGLSDKGILMDFQSAILSKAHPLKFVELLHELSSDMLNVLIELPPGRQTNKFAEYLQIVSEFFGKKNPYSGNPTFVNPYFNNQDLQKLVLTSMLKLQRRGYMNSVRELDLIASIHSTSVPSNTAVDIISGLYLTDKLNVTNLEILTEFYNQRIIDPVRLESAIGLHVDLGIPISTPGAGAGHSTASLSSKGLFGGGSGTGSGSGPQTGPQTGPQKGSR